MSVTAFSAVLGVIEIALAVLTLTGPGDAGPLQRCRFPRGRRQNEEWQSDAIYVQNYGASVGFHLTAKRPTATIVPYLNRKIHI